MKRTIAFILVFVLCFGISTNALADGELSTGEIIPVTNEISQEKMTEIIEKYDIECSEPTLDEEEIDALLLEYQNAQTYNALLSQKDASVNVPDNLRSLTEIEEDIERAGITKLEAEDVCSLLNISQDSITSTFAIPSVPNNTKYADFFLTSGQDSTSGFYYCTIIAQSNWSPEDGDYIEETHPLYNCVKTTVISNSDSHTESFLSQALSLLASEATEGYGTIAGLLFTDILSSIVDEALTTHSSFGASIKSVCKQTFKYTYVSETGNTYYHVQTTERVSILPIWQLGYSNNGNAYNETETLDHVIFTSENYSNVSDAIASAEEGDLSLVTYSVGTIRLRYQLTADSAVQTARLPLDYYQEIYAIPGFAG